MAIACAVTVYFLRQNLLGIHESSGKALKIMLATTIMGVVMLGWSGLTLAVRGPVNPIPSWKPDLHQKVQLDAQNNVVPKMDPITGEQQDPLGWIGRAPKLAEPIRNSTNWLSLIGVVGIIIAFGHSILAMSGEETLAQVYREVESPKLKNFKKVGFIVFAYSLLLTGSMNFLAVMLIPDRLRMTTYYDNWMGGLAMQMIGPVDLLLVFERVCGVCWFFDSVGRGEYVDRGVERCIEPGGGRWRTARLVSSSSPSVRHELPAAVPDNGAAIGDDLGESRKCHSAG